MLTPRVSIVIPVYNSESWLPDCIDSVLEQQVDGMEVIVINDGSTDGSGALLEQLSSKLVIIDQANRGAPAARNTGLSRAVGDYIAMLDADDCWNPGYLQRQLEILDAHPEVDITLEKLQTIRMTDGAWVAEGKPLHSMIFGACVFRRRLLDNVGFLDEEMRYCDDIEWFFRAQRAGVHIVKNDEVGLRYRRHSGNLTNDRELVSRYTLRAIKKHRLNNRPPSPDA